MANPQLEDGYLRISNELFQALYKIRISGECRQILDVIIYNTYGFNKKVDMISLSQFEKATGIPKPHIIRSVKKLINMNLIAKNGNGVIPSYCLQKDYDKWKALPKKVIVAKNGKKPLPKMVPTEIHIQNNKRYMSEFDEIWKKYPKKDGKKAALKHFSATVKNDADLENIKRALDNYISHIAKNNINAKYIKNGSTFFNNWHDWIDFEEPEGGYDKNKYNYGMKVVW